MCCAELLSHDSLRPHGLQHAVCPCSMQHAPLSMEILQTRILEWVAMPSSRGTSQPRDQTQVSNISGRFLTSWASMEAHICFWNKKYSISSGNLKIFIEITVWGCRCDWAINTFTFIVLSFLFSFLRWIINSTHRHLSPANQSKRFYYLAYLCSIAS